MKYQLERTNVQRPQSLPPYQREQSADMPSVSCLSRWEDDGGRIATNNPTPERAGQPRRDRSVLAPGSHAFGS